MHYLPYLNEGYDEPKLLAHLTQLVLFPVLAFLTINCDIGLVFFGFEIIAALDIINNFIKKRSQDIKSAPDYFKIVIKKHNDVIHNINKLNEAIELTSLVTVIGGNILFPCSLLLIRRGVLELGYALLACQIFPVLSLCLFGEFMKYKTEKIATTLYQTNWYDLNLKDQEIFLMILLISQRKYGLKIIGMYEMNMNTFVQVSFALP